MEWLKSSNVIVVTKSVTAIEAVVTRYLLTSKSEGITIDGNVWSEVRQNPTSENRYVWAYDTYHYTDRTTRNTSPYIFDEYQSPKFEVDFSSDSYEIHPRWNNTSYITFKVKKLNGLTGNITITQNSSSRGIGLPIYDTSSDSYSISIENKSTTSTSFSFTISISNCVETFEIKGMMVDADSKYIGTVSTLPDPNVCVEGDRCFYKPTDNEGSLYIYDSESSSWKSIDESGISVTEKNLIYTEAMKDIIDNIPANSSILSQYGFFNTIISSIIKAETSFVDDMYAKNLDVKNGNFKFEITSGIIKVSYNGNTVFQIDPSTGNVFFGKPNSGLSAPESGFMYKADEQSIISSGRNFKVNSDGYVEGKNMIISGDSEFNGKFDCDVIKTEVKSPTYTPFSISSSNPFHSYAMSKMLKDYGLNVGVLHRCSLNIIPDVYYCKFEEPFKGYDYQNNPITRGNLYFYDSNKNQIKISDKTTVMRRYQREVTVSTDADMLQTQMRTVDDDNNAYSVYASYYFSTGFTLTIITGGNVLKLTSIPENDAESEGQLYFVVENGKKKLCIK